MLSIVRATVLVAVLWGATPVPAQPPYYAIENARIVPVTGAVIERGTVVLSDGLISAVGTNVTIPPEAEVIDGAGLTVYPGLIDAFTTLGLPAARSGSGASQAAPGGSGPQRSDQSRPPPSRGPEDRPSSTPWEVAADTIAPNERQVERWRSGGFTTVVVSPDSGILPGQASLVNLVDEEPGEMVVVPSVALPIPMETLGRAAGFPSALMGVMAYVRQVVADAQHGARVSARYASAPRGQKRPEYDRTVNTLIELLSDRRPMLLPAETRVEILRMLDFAEELELNAVLYGAHGAYEAAAEVVARETPLLVSAKWPARDEDADPDADEPLRLLRLRDRAPSTPAALADAGATFAFYSDGLETPAKVLEKIRQAIDAGLTPEAALRALTQDAADIFGVGDRLGSVETGKIANLVVTEGGLFDEKSRVRLVFVDGQKFEPPPARDRAEEPSPTSDARPEAEGGRS